MPADVTTFISRVRRGTDILITVFSFVAAVFITRYRLLDDLRGLAIAPNYYLMLLLLIIVIWYICFQANGVGAEHCGAVAASSRRNKAI